MIGCSSDAALHDHVDLVVAVNTNRLLVERRIVPVVEDAVAATHRRLLGGVPGECGTRREVPLRVDLRLNFLPHSQAHLQRSCRLEVILQEPAGLGLRVVHQRFADAD